MVITYFLFFKYFKIKNRNLYNPNTNPEKQGTTDLFTVKQIAELIGDRDFTDKQIQFVSEFMTAGVMESGMVNTVSMGRWGKCS